MAASEAGSPNFTYQQQGPGARNPKAHFSGMTGGSRRFLCGLLIAWLCVISLESCGGSSAEVTTSGLGAGYRYAPSAELGTALVQTATGDVVARCPKGWMETMDVKNAPQIALWLVKEDYSASISFTPIAMDPALYATLKKDGLRSVAKVSLNLKKDYAQDSVKVIQETEYFRLNNRDFAAYEYSAGASDVVRVVVFDTGSRFMECVVMPATAPRDAEEIHRDFIVQQSVLASMVLR